MTSRGNSEYKSVLQILLLALVLAFTGTTWAQDDAAEESDESASLDRIAVTGSRIKRSELEGPQNVIVIDQAEMNERGYATVFEALDRLAFNNGFKFEGAETTNGFSPDAQTISLRSFGTGTTLLLINGRRLANYPVAYQSNTTIFDYGSIPVAAVERIEILSQGASAIYGSDAVAGVVNIVLRSDINQTTVNALWGTPTESKSSRGDTRIQLLNGNTYNRGSYTFTLEYMDREGIQGRHYDQYDHMLDYPYGTGVVDRQILSFDNFAWYWGLSPEPYRDPAVLLGRPGQEVCDQTGSTYMYRENRGWHCGNEDTGVGSINFRNARESISAYFNGNLEIGDKGTELFTDILYYDADSTQNGDWVFLNEQILDLTTPDPWGFEFYDWRLAQRGFTSEELGYPVDIEYSDKRWTVAAGVRGIFRDLHDWEFSYNHSEAEYTSSETRLKWREVIDTFLGTWLGVSFDGRDWWSGGTLGEDIGFPLGDVETYYSALNEAARNVFGQQTYTNETKNDFFQFQMTGDLYEMRAGPLSYAVVAEYEDQSLTYVPDELLQQSPPTTDVNGDPITGLTGSGWYRLTGYSGTGDRQRWAVGGELRIPLHETFTWNVAARYDDYDSTSSSQGGNVTPSTSIEWRPTGNLLVRVGYTESFRAPDLAQTFVNSGAFTTAFDYVSCQQQYEFINGSLEGFDTADCDSTSIFRQRLGPQDIGLPALDAETGETYWVGFSWDIMDNLNLTVDYTHMELTDRVFTQSTQGLLNDEYACFIGDEPTDTSCDQVGNQILRLTDPTSGISFIDEFFITSINTALEEGEWLDVKLVYNLNTEAGLFRFQGDYNNVISHERRITSDSEPFDLRNDPVNNNNDEFRASFVGSLTWSFRDFSTTLVAFYRGSTSVFNCTSQTNGCTGNLTGEDYLATGNVRVDSYTTWNWTAAYNFTDSLLARLRIINLFDEAPPWDDTIDSVDIPWYNPFVYGGGGIGRSAYLELEYTWNH
jgi:outer membrane receptor for ferrienterochelin and colicin